MAELSVETIGKAEGGGLEPSFTAADGAGDQCPNDGRTFIVVKNGDGSAHTVTFDAKEPGRFGKDIDPDAVTVPAGSEKWIGPFERGIYSATLEWSYDAVTSVTVRPVRLQAVTATG